MQLKKSDTLIMAVATAFIVANIYYCQPLIVLIADEFHISPAVAGRTSYFTQAGYAVGLLFLVPLGDMLERRKQIVFTTILAVLSLLMAASAKSFAVLQAACFLIGFASCVPQLILPLSAHLSAPEQRGKVVGIIMSGLLIGILASRTLSGFVGDLCGWRSMFYIAAVICLAIVFLIQFRFPQSMPNFDGNYKKLMGSITSLVKQEHVLREASAINFFVFMIFGSFWTNMVLLLANPPYHFESDQIGLFGLAGAAGALTAPLIGKLGDKANPRIAVGYGLAILFLAQVVFYFFSAHLFAFIAGIILLEMGQQAVHVSNQTRVYALNPAARNRLNTVLMTMSFIGAALGSALGLWFWDWQGWGAICIASATMALCGFLIYLLTYKKERIANS
ncbi:MFS transporter [Pelobium manganitolerans]|uniref:MFS transporter n=1 Tax=Pelobium manganitolerans TaxID=1842495 RepID=A0A419S607_9SPHI|nr:MFS transporter [Pelobium manganitolerans]RKD16290.1 MFS transporter [Pelobium manganitolerans]